MANEINVALTETGLATLVARIYTPGFTQVGSDVTLSEVSGPSGLYTGNAPAATLTNDFYHVVFFDTAGTPDTILGRGVLLWDASGDKEIEPEFLLSDIWKDRGLDPDESKLIEEIVEGSDYDEDVGAQIHKDTTKAGTTTTVNRT